MSNESILIVDDEKLIRLSLKSDLEREGYQTGSAENAEEALALLKRQPFDLLLSDYLMEGVNGIELMKKARELRPRIKVIIFSGFWGEASKEAILKAGANDFLCKPIDFDDLLGCISKLLES